MKMVIDVPKEMYENALNDRLCGSATLVNAIKTGTPLPKGHGRLIDANSIYQIVRPIEEADDGWGMTAETAKQLIHNAFDRAPTIIEADEGNEVE